MSLAATSLAVSGFYAKLAMRSVDLYLAVTSRFVLPCLLTGLWLIARHRTGEFNKDDLRASVGRSLALCLAQFTFYAAMQTSSLAQATILYNTGPLFITLHSAITRRVLSKERVLALTLGFTGVCIMGGAFHPQTDVGPVALGVLAGFFQSVSQILLHRASRQMDTTMLMLYTYVVGSVAWGLYLVLTMHPIALLPTAEPPKWVVLWLLGAALGSMGNQQLRGDAYKRVADPAVLSPLIYLSVAVAAALDYLVFRTQLQAHQWLGAVLIIAGAWTSSRDKD